MTFDARIENLMSKPLEWFLWVDTTLFVKSLFRQKSINNSRTEPRLEQYIRAKRAEELGLISMLVDNGDHDPKEMAKSLRKLPSQPRPSEILPTDILGDCRK